MKHKNKIADFLADLSFINWVKGTNEEDVANWNAKLEEQPEYLDAAKAAKQIIEGVSFHEKEIPQEEVNRNWNRLTDTLNIEETPNIRFLPHKKYWMGIAASLLFIIAAGWGVYQYLQSTNDFLEYATNFNETKEIQLPDGSSLILNANSKVRFSKKWLKQHIRTVELEGEAFFDIAKQAEGKKFRVQTPNLIVEVIGTQFNFNNKREGAIVSLVEGKVDLIKPGLPPQPLAAGQTAVLDRETDKFEIQANNTDYWSAWTQQKWSFGKGVPITEVLQRIKETYNLDYEVTDNALLQKTASGDVSIESRAVLLEALSYLLDINMTIKNDHLIISPAPPVDE